MSRQQYIEEVSAHHDVLGVAEQLCGSKEQARIWYLHESLQAFAGKTPQQLIATGRGQDLIAYLRSLQAGAAG